ncbi:MAG TPA: hypothetical protein PK177_02340 [Burkholderiaceae bacterium]|nr:hypothetical protein [Burkholderiaceae bacterium]
MNHPIRSTWPYLRWFLLLLLGTMLVLMLMASLLSNAAFGQLFEEHGLIEWLSFAIWLVVAAVFARMALRGGGVVAWLAVPVCIAAALRESDLHKSLTGYSVLKLGFYSSPDFAAWQKAVAGLAVAITAIALIALLALAVRSALRNGIVNPPMLLLILAVGLLVVTKVFDRAPAVLLEDFGIALSDLTRRWLQAFEEGLEALLPVPFLLAFIASRASSTTAAPFSRSG